MVQAGVAHGETWLQAGAAGEIAGGAIPALVAARRLVQRHRTRASPVATASDSSGRCPAAAIIATIARTASTRATSMPGKSGDRLSGCGGMMAPIGAFQRPNGEHVIVHHCERCGFERFNRIQADDDFELGLALPVVLPLGQSDGQRDPR